MQTHAIITLSTGSSVTILGCAYEPVDEAMQDADSPEDLIGLVADAIAVGRVFWTPEGWQCFNVAHVVRITCRSFDA